MRLLIGPREPGARVDESDLAELYAKPADHGGAWLRVNMVSTLDGAAQGADNVSGSINNPVDKKVFDALRDLADCLIVGAGTLRAEDYGLPVQADGTPLPLVVVSQRGQLPDRIRRERASHPEHPVLLATVTGSEGEQAAVELLGAEQVIASPGQVDLVALKARLAERGWLELLSEGGPSLLRDLAAAGVADELCLTLVPMLVAGDGIRVAQGDNLSLKASPTLLLEEQGTLLGRWAFQR